MLAAAVMLGALFAFTCETAEPVDAGAVVATRPTADEPSPTLGSTEPPNPNRAGPADADPNDYTGTIWVVAGMLTFVVLAGAGTFFLLRTHRIDMTQLSRSERPDKEKP